MMQKLKTAAIVELCALVGTEMLEGPDHWSHSPKRRYSSEPETWVCYVKDFSLTRKFSLTRSGFLSFELNGMKIPRKWGLKLVASYELRQIRDLKNKLKGGKR